MSMYVYNCYMVRREGSMEWLLYETAICCDYCIMHYNASHVIMCAHMHKGLFRCYAVPRDVVHGSYNHSYICS